MPTVEELFSLALQHHQSGKVHQAEQLYRQILIADPEHADAHHLLGVLACQEGQYRQAVALIRRAITLDGQSAVYYANLGVAYEAWGHLEEATACYQQALQLRPEDADSHYNLGNVFRQQRKLDEAAAHYRKALQLMPDYSKAHGNLGLVLAEQGRLNDAINHQRQALRLNPHCAEAHNNLGVALTAQGALDEAAIHLREALHLKPDFAQAHHSLGCALELQNRLDEALACYNQALQLDGACAEAHWNRSLLWLLHGDFERGWQEYEWRWTQPSFTRRHVETPRWDGSNLDGQTILLHAEQGLGDTLQFVRYVQLVKQRRGKVIVECQLPLEPVLAGVPGIDDLAAQGCTVPSFDVQAPLLSLPGILRTSLASIPAAVPYLQADPALLAHWRRELAAVPGIKVGIAWQGNPSFRGDARRSIPLAQFAPLIRAEGVQLISLQKGPGTEQIPALAGNLDLVDLNGRLDEGSGPFMDTAAVIMNLELVIACDSAVAHLAGALGAPVWVALPVVPDWRWLLEREDSPWYPTMRLFRQTRAGHWEDVFERMAEELQKLRN